MIFSFYKKGENKRLDSATSQIYNSILTFGYLKGYQDASVVFKTNDH